MCEESLTNLGQNTHTHTHTYLQLIQTMRLPSILIILFALWSFYLMDDRAVWGRKTSAPQFQGDSESLGLLYITAWKKTVLQHIVQQTMHLQRNLPLMHKYAFSGIMPLEKQAPCWHEELSHRRSILRVPITIAGRTCFFGVFTPQELVMILAIGMPFEGTKLAPTLE